MMLGKEGFLLLLYLSMWVDEGNESLTSHFYLVASSSVCLVGGLKV